MKRIRGYESGTGPDALLLVWDGAKLEVKDDFWNIGESEEEEQ